ncbi:MAG: hypothetical protein DCF15_11565 [Phormidesmis priestleyi]|uniref:Short-chain dehydrogenase n=1 Tax=Phormidesmis priestleyi TaxID=268141 RepID=A0A2W4XBU7_9CYAN|nr:MAG: hypothetical protein DCF15_11565 [Phormidesmis priestleyi]
MCLDSRSPQRLENKVALVTSSSTGICASTAMLLAGEGAKVMICGRDGVQGMNTVRQIRNRGGSATFVLADIAVLADVQAAVDETIATYGRLDILFNAASSSYGQLTPAESLSEVSETAWDQMNEAVLKGTFFCCQCALPFLQQSDAGTIINLIQPLPQAQTHLIAAVCQGGIVALTKAVAHQLSAKVDSCLGVIKLTYSATANLIWVAPDLTASGLNPLADSNSTAATGLGAGQLLTGPRDEGGAIARTFADSAEAIVYLAAHGRDLQGCTLWVKG